MRLGSRLMPTDHSRRILQDANKLESMNPRDARLVRMLSSAVGLTGPCVLCSCSRESGTPIPHCTGGYVADSVTVRLSPADSRALNGPSPAS